MSATVDSRAVSLRIQEEFNRGYELKPFPDAVNKMLQALRDPKSDIKLIESIVESDPGLSTRILRLANSPLFGASQEINSVARAIVMLGRGKLKSLALTFAGSSIFMGNSEKALWNHSMGCAVTAREIANLAGVDVELAFIAGIFHDVGKLFFWDIFPEEYASLTKRKFAGSALVDAEKEMFGICHAEVGQKLAISWPLPAEVKEAIRFHHSVTTNTLVSTIILADALAWRFGIGSNPCDRIEVPEIARTEFGINEEALDLIRELSLQSFDEMKAIG